MISTIFKPSDSISVSYFLYNSKKACDRNIIHEGVPMCLCQHFMKDQGKAALEYRICASNEDDPEQEGRLTTYCQIVIYLLAIYASNNVIAKAEADITNFMETEGMSSVRY